MLTAITREISPALAHCELSYLPRQPIDFPRARQQHRTYQQALAALGVLVVTLPAEPDLPDSVFVEDPAIVLNELAVILPLGAESRRREADSLAQALSPYRKLARIELPATIEGGDVLRIGRRLLVGLSQRTNAEGIRRLSEILAPFNYEVLPVQITGCLHLKSAVTCLGFFGGKPVLLANRAWFDTAPFAGCDWIDVAPEEPHAANALELCGSVLFPKSFPRTRQLIEQRGRDVVALDISELQKAESGLTCSSLIFETR
jgi:dimethylargininase